MSQRAENLVQMLDAYKSLHTEKPCVIYKLTSNTTNLSYIGQTTQIPITNRFKKNGKGYLYTTKSGCYTKFGEAIIKYGFDDFNVEILEICPINVGNDREKYYIKLYDTYNNGYNSEDGGTLGKNVCDASKNKRSESLMGHSVSQEVKLALSNFRKSCVGKYKHSNETKLKMSKNNNRSSSCFMLDLNTLKVEEYCSIRELVRNHKDFVYSTVVDSIKFNKVYNKRYIIRRTKEELVCQSV